MSRFDSTGVICGLALALTLSAFAQVPDPVVAAQAPIPGAGHHYIGTGAETVNPADGSLSFDLPFDPAPGRQISLKFGIRFSGTEQFYLSNQGYSGNITWYPNWQFGQAPWQVGAWSYDLPIVTAQSSIYWTGVTADCPNGVCTYHYSRCWGNDSYVFRGLDGTQYSLPIGNVLPAYNNYLSNFCPAAPNNYKSPGNRHGILSTLDPNTWAVTVVDPSGTTYQFPAAGGSEPQPPNYWPAKGGNLASSITDRNGNQLVLSGNSYKDSTGRTAVSWSGIGNNGDTISVAGLGGPVTLKWITTPVSFPETGYSLGNPCTITPSNTSSVSVVNEIDLPNGQKYSFLYDGVHGKVSKITFPDGGYVRYIWGENTSAQLAHMTWTDPSNNPASCDFIYDIPAISDRYVSFDGSTEVLHQHFAYSTAWSGNTWASKTTVVTTTDLLTGQITITQYGYGAVSGDNNAYVTQSPLLNLIPVESSVTYEDGSGKAFKSVNKTWLTSHVMASDQTIMYDTLGNPGLGTANVRCYDSNEQAIGSYDYGFQTEGSYPGNSCGGVVSSYAGPLRRKTSTVYHVFTGTHIVNAPDSITISDGSNNIVKQTLYAYDQTALRASSAINLASVTGARANITTLQRLISGSTYTTTKYKYWDTGQVYQITDACGNTTCSDMTGTNHTTSYSYGDKYATGTGTAPGQTSAYLTQVVFPNTGVAHIEQFSWGYTDGQIRSHTDQNSRTTDFKYNDPGLMGRLTEIDNPDGGKTLVSYNDSTYNSTNNTPNFTVTKSIKSSLNLVTTTAFDGLGHKVRSVTADPQGAIYGDIVYNGLAQAWKEYNPYRTGDLLYFKQNAYDPLGRIVSTVMQDGSNSTVTTAYSFPCTTVTDEAGKQRHSCSDSLGRLTEVDEPGFTSAQTSGTGSVTISGSERTYTYTYVCGPNGQTCQTIIPDVGNVSITVNGASATVAYGSTDTAASIASALAATINGNSSYPTTASASGPVVNLTAKSGGVASNYSLTASSATTDTQYFSGTSFPVTTSGSTLTGGTDGNIYSWQTPAVTLYNYDVLGNLLCVWQKNTDTTSATFAYNPANNTSNCLSAASATWRPRSFAYDSLSRLLSATNPEAGSISYTYDANANVMTKTAPSPNQPSTGTATVNTNYTYDTLNRFTGKSYSDTYTANSSTPSVLYYYDESSIWGVSPTNPKGRLTHTWSSICANNVFSYDPMGRIVGTWPSTPTNCGTSSYPLQYSYDLMGNLTSITEAPGWTISYQFDAVGRPSLVTSSQNDSQHPGTLFTADATRGYLPSGALRLATLGNNLTLTAAYNSRLQPCRSNLNTSSAYLTNCTDAIPAGNLQDFSYGYNAGASDNGTLAAFTATGVQNFARSYSYDPLNRLATMTGNSGCTGLSWSYDAWGNRTAQTTTGGSCLTFSSAANTQNRLVGYTYDAAGNMINDGHHSYTYDAENRITQVDGGTTATYVYDAEGQRVQSTTPGAGITDYVRDPAGNVVTEYGPCSGGVRCGTYVYVYLNGALLTQYTNSTTYFVHSDHLGSTRLLTDLSRHVYDSLDYQPFGEQIAGDTGTKHKFTGKERDSESGLDNFGARYYGSNLGRFMSPDWAARPTVVPYAIFGDPQSLNLYGYVRNDPVSRADLDGHGDDHACTSNPGSHDPTSNGTMTTPNTQTCAQAEKKEDQIKAQNTQAAAASAAAGCLAGGCEAASSGTASTAAGTVLTDVLFVVAAPLIILEYLISPGTTATEDKDTVHTPTQQSGPKAADAPGVTAGGQATDAHGNKLGPSGETQVDRTRSNTREGARNRALGEGSGAVEHRNPRVGSRHWHPTDAQGNKKPSSTHHEYPDE